VGTVELGIAPEWCPLEMRVKDLFALNSRDTVRKSLRFWDRTGSRYAALASGSTTGRVLQTLYSTTVKALKRFGPLSVRDRRTVF